jgi:hypothetical protein
MYYSNKFTPQYKFDKLLDFNKTYGLAGKNKFYGSHEKDEYEKIRKLFLEKNIPEALWPYYEIEEDFYTFNSMGYRTYEFNEIADKKFDLTIGCSYTEGVGLRFNEIWTHYYETHFGTKLVNLAKGGASADYISLTLMAWVNSNMPLPNSIVILWTNPFRKSYIKYYDDIEHVSSGFSALEDSSEQLHVDIVNNFKSFMNSNSDEFWSNDFMKNFNIVNILAKSLKIPIYNFIIKDMWPLHDEKDFGHDAKTLDFFHNVNGWISVEHTGGKKIYPAKDGVHFGKQHHYSVFQQIRHQIEYGKNQSSI